MEKLAHQSFTELEVWKKARTLKREITNLVKTFPTEEKFRLTDQLIRFSRSINALIAEGHGRFTHKDQLHYCVQARGSLSETYNHLIDAYDESFITKEQLITFKNKIDEVERFLNGYITPTSAKAPARKHLSTCQPINLLTTQRNHLVNYSISQTAHAHLHLRR